MFRLIVIIAIYVVTVNAQDFLHEVNATYTSASYKKLLYTNKNLTLNRFESNSTQQKIKTDFEVLLPQYLDSKSLFSKERFAMLEEPDFSISQLRFLDFMTVSRAYLALLEEQKEWEKRDALLEKNLADLEALMRNSKGMVNYILSLANYKKIYVAFSKSKQSCALIQKYSLPEEDIFFQRFNHERAWLLRQIDTLDHIDEIDEDDFDEKAYQQFMTQAKQSSKKYVNHYFDAIIAGIKTQSRDELKEVYKTMDIEQKSLMSQWNMARFILSGVKARIIYHIFGSIDDYGFMTDFIGKTIALVAIPKVGDTYIEHIELMNQYEALVKECSLETGYASEHI